MEKSKKSRKRGYFLYDFGKITAVIPCLLWYRMKRLYASPEAKKKIKGGAILISNHSGNVDPIAIMTAVWYRRHFTPEGWKKGEEECGMRKIKGEIKRGNIC